MISRVGGKYYVVENRCPHAGGDLSAGKLEANVVTCHFPNPLSISY
jgi:nitrite reductase/ring-hydroxylating ferredoxin subunit